MPKGWILAPLGELTSINPRKFDREPGDEDHVSFVPMTLVEAGSGRLDSSGSRLWRDVRKGYTRFQENNVLFAKITPCMENAKIALAANLVSGRGAGSTEFHVIRPTAAILSKFVLYYLLQERVRREARMSMRGAAGQLRVPPEFIDHIEIPIAPMPEQDRIIQEIEKQFTRLEAAVVALKRVQSNLKRYRAAVLKAACEGCLVPTEADLARREGRPYEPASALLDRILTERRSRWEAAQIAKLNTAGRMFRDEKWKARYQEPKGTETGIISSLPEGWDWAAVSQIGEVQLGRQRSPKNRSRNYPTKYIRAANITENGIDVSDVLDMEFQPEERKRYLLRSGDIVLSEASGSPMQVGKPAIWRDELPECCFQNTVIRLRPSHVLSEYLLVAFQAYYSNGLFAKVAGGVGINHLGAEKFSAIAVPVPPLPEQSRIVPEVERRLSVIYELQAEVETNMKRAARLRQSILKRAFEGQLIAQDPTDEPASALIERIRAEREAKSGNVKAKRQARGVGVR